MYKTPIHYIVNVSNCQISVLGWIELCLFCVWGVGVLSGFCCVLWFVLVSFDGVYVMEELDIIMRLCYCCSSSPSQGSGEITNKKPPYTNVYIHLCITYARAPLHKNAHGRFADYHL